MRFYFLYYILGILLLILITYEFTKPLNLTKKDLKIMDKLVNHFSTNQLLHIQKLIEIGLFMLIVILFYLGSMTFWK